MVKIKDIAERAGVSPSTVSNVLHGNTARVSPEKRERIQRIITELGYFPSMSAISLAHNKSKIIGVIMNDDLRDIEGPSFTDPFVAAMIGSIEQKIRLSGYFMMLNVANSASEVQRLLVAWKLDGIIILGMWSEDCSRVVSSTDVPIVFIDNYFVDSNPRYYNIGIEDARGAYEMTKYLIDGGHRHISFFVESLHPMGVDLMRIEGVKQAFTENGIPFDADKNIHLISHDVKVRDTVFENIYRNRDDYSALFFTSDYFAITAITFFRKEGLRIPEDLSIAGFDDSVFAQILDPSLTTVNQNVFEKGQRAVETLIALANGRNVEEPIGVPARNPGEGFFLTHNLDERS